MKFDIRSIVATASVASLLFLSACDWSSGSQENFNTSGSVDDSNISNEYLGILPGGRAVSQSSAGSVITRLNIQQSGVNIAVQDNQGSNYDGFVGKRVITSDNLDSRRTDLIFPSSQGGGTTTEGQRSVIFQVSFSGTDKVAGKEIEFSGFMEMATVITVRFVPGVDSEGNSTVERVENTSLTSTLKGTWIEQGGVTSQVAAQVRSNSERVLQIPELNPQDGNPGPSS